MLRDNEFLIVLIIRFVYLLQHYGLVSLQSDSIHHRYLLSR